MRITVLLLLLATSLTTFGQITEEWASSWVEPDARISPRRQFIDHDENIYVYSMEKAAVYPWGIDLRIVKYDRLGNVLWAKLDTSVSYISDVVQDDQGTVYMIGSKLVNLPYSDVEPRLMAYDTSGQKIWIINALINLPTADRAVLKLSGSNHLVFAMQDFSVITPNPDIFVGRTDRQGNIDWIQTYGSTTNHTMEDMNVDGNENIFLTGISGIDYDQNNFFIDGDLMLTKYSPTGNLLWESHYSNGNYDYVRGHHILFDDQNDLYIQGHVGAQDTVNTIVLKFQADSSLVWSEITPQYSNRPFYPKGLVLDGNSIRSLSNRAFDVQGYSYVVNSYNSSNGTPEWQYAAQTTSNSYTTGKKMLKDANGTLFVIGDHRIGQGMNSNYRFALNIISPQGNPLDSALFLAPGSTNEYPRDMSIAPSGAMYVSCLRDTFSNDVELMVRKLSSPLVGLEEATLGFDVTVAPHPVSDRARFQFSEPVLPGTTQ